MHHMQANVGVGHRSEGARALSSVAAQRTAGRVRQLQQVQIVTIVSVHRLQQSRQKCHRTVSGLWYDVRDIRVATAPPDHRPQKTFSLFQMQGNDNTKNRLTKTFLKYFMDLVLSRKKARFLIIPRCIFCFLYRF